MVSSVSSDLHVLIADDHDLFRQGLRYALLDGLSPVRVSEAASLDEALRILEQSPDVGLASCDLRMPGMRGGEGLRDLRRLRPALPITVLSGYEDRRNILMILEYGASGFIPKSLSAEEIVAAMRDVLVGRIYVPPSITALADQETTECDPTPAEPTSVFNPASLTPRQREVLEFLLLGQSSKEIARNLGIAEGTVKIYVAAIFRAMGVRNRVEAVSRATALGIGRKPLDSR